MDDEEAEEENSMGVGMDDQYSEEEAEEEEQENEEQKREREERQQKVLEYKDEMSSIFRNFIRYLERHPEDFETIKQLNRKGNQD